MYARLAGRRQVYYLVFFPLLEAPNWGIVCCSGADAGGDRNTTTVGVESPLPGLRINDLIRGIINRRPRPREASNGLDVNGAQCSTSIVVNEFPKKNIQNIFIQNLYG